MRLDLAPSLNWLSRRSVIAAIHSGQLTVEPMHFATLLEELAPPNIPASSHHTHIACALCGMPIYSTSSDSPASTPTTPNGPRSGSQSASWSTNLFKNVRAGELNLSTPFTGHNRHSAQFGTPSAEPPSQLYIFRLDATSSGLPVSLPMSQQQSTPPRQAIYPLCTSGWCLARLRSTCSLWAFVRTSIVEKIWEEPPMVTPNGHGKPGVNGIEQKHDGPNGIAADKQPTIQAPPRRTKMGLGSLWGTMQRSLSGTREPDRTAEATKIKEDGRPKLPPRDPSRKTLPPPPPSHPAVSHSSKDSVSGPVHRVPPPFKDSTSSSPAPTSAPLPVTSGVPPPLPKRNRERDARSSTSDVEHKAEANGVSNGEAHPAIATEETTSAESVEASDEVPASTAQGPDVEAPKQEDSAEDPTITPKPELVVPQTISRATSNDSFTTPTEELAPPLDVSHAAASVALPSSQDSSPVELETAPVSDAAATTGTSPVDTTPAPSAPQDDTPPSRTGSPAPPPLPRRAAARARPSSTLVPQNVEPAKSDSLDAAPESDKAAAPGSSEAAAAPAQDVPIAGEPTAVTTEPEQIMPAEEASLADAQPASEAPTDVEGEAKEAVNEGEVAHSAVDVKEVHLNGDVPPADAVSVQESTATVVPAEPVEVEAKADEQGQDNGQYVGDATWEERTYKELVRLREEMFWARIGAAVH